MAKHTRIETARSKGYSLHSAAPRLTVLNKLNSNQPVGETAVYIAADSGTEIVDLALSDPIHGARSTTRRIHISGIENRKFAIKEKINRPGADAYVSIAFGDHRVTDR